LRFFNYPKGEWVKYKISQNLQQFLKRERILDDAKKLRRAWIK